MWVQKTPRTQINACQVLSSFKYYTITAPERDQYQVLWSRVLCSIKPHIDEVQV
jgi:hypothetical protein